MNEIVGILLGLLGIYVALMLTGVHTIHEGYVGIYKNRGVLSPTLTGPGIHFALPFFQSYEEIQTTVQTDEVKDIPCGTSGGTLVYFDKIEVVNRLKKHLVYETIKNYTSAYDKFWIYNKIHHEINQFCSKHTLSEIYIDMFENLDEELIKSLQTDLNIWAPGIEILSIRITKPRIPESIRKNFEMMEQTKVEYLISSERQKVTVEQQNTVHKRQIIQAESALEVKMIELQKLIQKKENELQVAQIEAEISFDKAKAETEASFLASTKEVEMQPRLLSHSFLAYTGVLAFTENSNIVIGDRIPNVVSSLKI